MKLRMRYAIPFALESKLCNKFGFAVDSRKFQDCITFVKSKTRPGRTTIRASALTSNVTVSPGLTAEEQKKLVERCDTIVDWFPDPYNAIMAVRQRLHNVSQALPSMAARQFVVDYMEENFPEDYAQFSRNKKKA